MARATLSLCMIVKNEQEMLPGMLASVEGLWDELIVADTGSTDGTVAILQTAGAQIIHHVWQDDFSAARNASLAEATCDWILFLDADERLTKTLASQISTLMETPNAGAATIVMHNDLPGGLHREAPLLRLFHNDPNIRFKYRIHEDVSESVGAYLTQTNRKMVALTGNVLHLGYVLEVASAKDKKARDLALLEKSVALDPQDFYCWFKIMEQARFWNDRALWQETASRTWSQWQQFETDLSTYSWSGELVAVMSQGLFDDPQESLTWLENQGLRVQQNGPYLFRRGILLESLGKLDEATEAFTRCIEFYGTGQAIMQKVRPLLGLCRLAAAEGNMHSAAKFARQAAKSAPRDPEAMVAMAMFVDLAEGPDVLHQVVLEHVQTNENTVIVLGQALLTCGKLNLAELILTEDFPRNEEAALGLLVLALIEGRDLDIQINLTQEKADLAFQSWIMTLLRSRQPKLVQGFLDHCESVGDIFPWLPDWLHKTSSAE